MRGPTEDTTATRPADARGEPAVRRGRRAAEDEPTAGWDDEPVDRRRRPGRRRPAGDEPGGLVLGRYRLERRLGAGGFGVVWLAHDEHLERPVAVKRIPVHSEAMAQRAEREARAAARLQHPGIVALYEAGRDDDAVHLVSELVRGRTLAALMRDGRLSDLDVLGVGIALCDALDHAHRRGVVHRDVKPGNVIVPDAPERAGAIAKLTDFGVASVAGDEPLTVTGDVVGTLAYMAPEQAEGRHAGPEADLYALALVLFEALSGTNPVRGPNAAATARRVGTRLPALRSVRRDLDPHLAAALDRALDPDPRGRGDLLDLRDALADALGTVDEEPGTIAVAPIEHLARRPRRRVPERLLAGVAAGALVAAGAVVYGQPPLAGLAAAALVAVLPRLGWLAAVAAATAWLAAEAPDDAWALLAAAVPVLLLLPRAPAWWSLPAAGLAGPVAAAVAGQAREARTRAAVAALAAWWVALLDVRDPALALQEPALLAHLAVWVPAAVVLPWLVRGRSLVPDALLAAAWAAAVAAGSAEAARALAIRPEGAEGWLAALAGALAVLGAARRAGAEPRWTT